MICSSVLKSGGKVVQKIKLTGRISGRVYLTVFSPAPRVIARDCFSESLMGFRQKFGIKKQSPVAQLVEQHAVNVPVRGSSPRGGATLKYRMPPLGLRYFSFIFLLITALNR